MHVFAKPQPQIFINQFVTGVLTDLQKKYNQKPFQAQKSNLFIFEDCPQGMGERVCAELQHVPPYFSTAVSSFVIKMF